MSAVCGSLEPVGTGPRTFGNRDWDRSVIEGKEASPARSGLRRTVAPLGSAVAGDVPVAARLAAQQLVSDSGCGDPDNERDQQRSGW